MLRGAGWKFKWKPKKIIKFKQQALPFLKISGDQKKDFFVFNSNCRLNRVSGTTTSKIYFDFNEQKSSFFHVVARTVDSLQPCDGVPVGNGSNKLKRIRTI